MINDNPRIPPPTWAQIIAIAILVLNTLLILTGHHELSQDMGRAADAAAYNAAAQVAQDCRQAFASTPTAPDHQP